MKNNLFTFGCSYTNYRTPTYADFMAPYFNKVYNSGVAGSGNRAIFNRIHYFISNNLINQNDTVIVQWSSIPREDRILNNGNNNWVPCGLVTNNSIYDIEWVNKWFNPYQNIIELLSYIQSINSMMVNITKQFKWFYFHEPWVDNSLGETGISQSTISDLDFIKKTGILNKIKNISMKHSDYLDSIEQFYGKTVEKIDNYYTYIHNDTVFVDYDTHPNPYVHYLFSKKILKSLNIELINDTSINENAISWKNYSSDKTMIYEYESNYYKEHKSNQTNYANFNIKWPSYNIMHNIESNNNYNYKLI